MRKPLTPEQRQRSLVRRFWLHVDKREPDTCWEWKASVNRPGGYGQIGIRVNGRTKIRKASNVSYEIHYSPIPEGLEICHSCDNPPCVNPSHLWAGTHQENIDDALAKGRRFGRRAKLTPSMITAIRNAEGSHVQIARRFKFAPGTICQVRNGTYGSPPGYKSKGRPPKISPQTVREIKLSREDRRVLAERYGITTMTVSRIWKNVGWYGSVDTEVAA